MEGFKEAARHLPDSLAKEIAFGDRLAATSQKATEPGESIVAGEGGAMHERITTLKKDCRECHRRFRD